MQPFFLHFDLWNLGLQKRLVTLHGLVTWRLVENATSVDGPNMDVSKNRGGPPKSSYFNRVFHYEPSILGYNYFWKHPYDDENLRYCVYVCFFATAALMCAGA